MSAMIAGQTATLNDVLVKIKDKLKGTLKVELHGYDPLTGRGGYSSGQI